MSRYIATIAALLLASATAQAQDQSTTYQTPRGEVTVNSGQPQPRDYGPAPSFAQLDRNGNGYIGSDQADAYPPLANDFIHADGNRDGRISRAEYERWAAHR
ncbi:hypothetical protein [Dokdonella sp.]|uniref:hypothetical protein n=1 Tax=Dokdonella sp. TaxID=2291710 RepID=UPI003783C1FA